MKHKTQALPQHQGSHHQKAKLLKELQEAELDFINDEEDLADEEEGNLNSTYQYGKTISTRQA